MKKDGVVGGVRGWSVTKEIWLAIVAQYKTWLLYFGSKMFGLRYLLKTGLVLPYYQQNVVVVMRNSIAHTT